MRDISTIAPLIALAVATAAAAGEGLVADRFSFVLEGSDERHRAGTLRAEILLRDT